MQTSDSIQLGGDLREAPAGGVQRKAGLFHSAV